MVPCWSVAEPWSWITSPTLNFAPAAGDEIEGVGGVFGFCEVQLARAMAGQASSKYSTMTVCWPAVITLLALTVLTAPEAQSSRTGWLSTKMRMPSSLVVKL